MQVLNNYLLLLRGATWSVILMLEMNKTKRYDTGSISDILVCSIASYLVTKWLRYMTEGILICPKLEYR